MCNTRLSRLRTMSWWPQCSKPQYQTCHDSRLRSAFRWSSLRNGTAFRVRASLVSRDLQNFSSGPQLGRTTAAWDSLVTQVTPLKSVEIRWDPWPVTKCQKSTTFSRNSKPQNLWDPFVQLGWFSSRQGTKWRREPRSRKPHREPLQTPSARVTTQSANTEIHRDIKYPTLIEDGTAVLRNTQDPLGHWSAKHQVHLPLLDQLWCLRTGSKRLGSIAQAKGYGARNNNALLNSKVQNAAHHIFSQDFQSAGRCHLGFKALHESHQALPWRWHIDSCTLKYTDSICTCSCKHRHKLKTRKG